MQHCILWGNAVKFINVTNTKPERIALNEYKYTDKTTFSIYIAKGSSKSGKLDKHFTVDFFI